MSRPLKPESDSPKMMTATEADDAGGKEGFQRLANLPLLRLGELERQVDRCLEQHPTITLPEVLIAFPPKHGMMEVLGYLILAARGEGRHFINEKVVREIVLPCSGGSTWAVPAVMFCRK